MELTQELKHAALTEPLVDFFGRYFGSHRAQELILKTHQRSVEDATKVKAFDGILETIETLASRGSRIAVLTNRDLDSAQIILKSTGLARFTDLCLSGTCVKRKPSTEGLLKIVDHFECLPQNVTMVGDHDHDVEIAKATGARSVRVSWHSYWPVDPCRVADHHFHEVHDFARWVKDGG
jgi:HAD superfamily hydrolase (TIGR01662 family)